jgi:hypothetical protein
LTLDQADATQAGDHAEVWEKVVRKLRAGVMPPAGSPRPDAATREALVSSLETALDAAATAAPNPGRPATLHRLNRAEYHNVIRDLLSLDIDVAALLPSDDASYGFDNIGDILTVSPALLEGYLEAARRISQEAVGDPGIASETYTYRVAPDLTQDSRLDGLPFGTRGGALIHHTFPVDGEYVVKVDLLRSFIGGIMGLAEQHQLEIAVDGERITTFAVGGKKWSAKEGDEAVEASAGKTSKEQPEDAPLRVRLPIKAGPRVVSVTFLQRPSVESEDLREPYLRSYAVLSDFANGQPHIGSVSITGPFAATVGETPSRRRILVCRPERESEETACAKQILTALTRRAFRRPVTDADIRVMLAFYDAGRAKTGRFDDGIERAVQRLLVSPEFLVRIERDPEQIAPNTNYRVSDLDLASRLAFFLWSSIPDEPLLQLAERGRLREPAVLAGEVRRMLADARAQALITNFAAQWLYLRNVPASRPDTQLFPDYDDNLRQSLRRETELLFDSVVREDRSIVDLIGARYTFVNERLARHYGVPNIYGSQFRRIPLADDSPRGGLLGQGSVMTVLSYPNRTSPVQRGKWIMENILGSAPPPPPPNVPDLPEATSDATVRSMRERMVQHRANPVCASCHSRIDPLGLPFELFDAVGRYRTSESNTPIDASGALPDGTTFNGPVELRQRLLANPERFISTVTEKLLTYALGRGLDSYDGPSVRGILREAARNEYRFSSLVTAIVNSPPFQMRRSLS